MRDVFVSTLAFSLTMSVAALLTPSKPIPAEPWLTDNFDRLVTFKMCGDYWAWESVPPRMPESSRTEEQCGAIPIPNLKLPTKPSTLTH